MFAAENAEIHRGKNVKGDESELMKKERRNLAGKQEIQEK